MGITGVPFGRSTQIISGACRGLLDEVPKLIRVPVGDFSKDFMLIFMFFEKIFLQKNMKMVDEDGWMLEFRAENDTK